MSTVTLLAEHNVLPVCVTGSWARWRCWRSTMYCLCAWQDREHGDAAGGAWCIACVRDRIVSTVTLLAEQLGCYKMGLDCTDKMKSFYHTFGYDGEKGNDNTMVIRFAPPKQASLWSEDPLPNEWSRSTTVTNAQCEDIEWSGCAKWHSGCGPLISLSWIVWI